MFGLSHEEAARNGYGTQRRRYGADFQTKFGNCAISNQPARDPVASPQGIIFDREAILRYLLDCKVKLREQARAYEAQQADEQAATEAAAAAEAAAAEKAFRTKRMSSETSAAPSSSSSFSASSSAVGSAASLDATVVARIQRGARDTETLAEKRERLRKTNFWVAEVAPAAKAKKLLPPDKCPRCPVTNKYLKSKHLMPVVFQRDPTVERGEPGSIICAALHTPIVHQKVSLLKACGHVVLTSCLNDLVLPSMRCPLCSKRVKAKGIVPLRPGGSSFSAHSQVESTTWKPAMR